MGIIKMKGANMKYFSYKQGYWFDKSVTEGPDFSTKTLKDKAGEDVEVSGQFETAIGGSVTALNIKDVEAGGSKFSVLEVDIDGTERLSMGTSSPAAHAVMETFENLDFSKDVVLTAWTDKAGYNKLSIKQDGEHVKNSFIEFTENEDGSYTVNHKNGYPERLGKDASKSEKAIAKIQLQEFLENHFNTNIKNKVTPREVEVQDTTASDEPEDDFEASLRAAAEEM